MATATLTLCIGLIVILLYKILHNYYKQIKFCRNYPTYCPLLPIIGHGYVYFGMKGEDILTRVMEIVSCDSKHRKLALVIGNSWTVWYYHPEPIEEILSSTNMITKSDDYDYLIVSFIFCIVIIFDRKRHFKSLIFSHGWGQVYYFQPIKNGILEGNS